MLEFHTNTTIPSAKHLELSNCILIAIPDEEDHIFSKAVLYICDHGEQGSLGILLNKAINLSLNELFEKLELKLPKTSKQGANPILLGGPVESDKGFVIHPNQAHKFLSNIERKLTITTSMDILEHLGKKNGPKDFIIALGCSMWESGQLLAEIKANRWLIVPMEQNETALEDFLFKVAPQKKYQAALGLLGVKPWQVSMFGGTA